MELTQQKDAFTELDAKYNEAVTQMEQQKGINAELDAKINQQLSELSASKDQIATLIRDKKTTKVQLLTWERQKNEYLVQIDDLKKQVGILTESNATEYTKPAVVHIAQRNTDQTARRKHRQSSVNFSVLHWKPKRQR